MGSIRHWRHALTVMAIAGLIAATAAVTPNLASSVAADHSLELYWSEQFDYLFFYDPTIWVIEEEWSDLESDYVFLSNGEVFVYYLGFEATGLTTEDCLQDVLAEFAADPEILRVEPLAEDLSEPAFTTDATTSTTHLVLTIEESGEQYTLVTEETCHQLVPGESLLYISTNVSAERDNELGGINPFLTTPAIALSLPELEARANQTTTGQVPVLAADDAIIGTLQGHLHCVADGPPQLLMLARALAEDDDLMIDAGAFSFTAANGEESAAVFGDWLYPEMEDETSLLLEPGEIGLLWIDLPGDQASYDLSYAPAEPAAPDSPLPLGPIHADACTTPAPSFPTSINLD